MQRTINEMVAFVPLIFMFHSAAFGQGFAVTAAAEPPKDVVLGYFLYESGDSLGCSFTIERVEDLQDLSSPLSDGRMIKVAAQPKTVDDLVKLLSQELQGVTVVRDPQRKNIIRMTEDKLSKLEKYVMSEKVSLKFSGTLFEMVDKLQSIDARVCMPVSFPIGSPVPDEVTDVEVNVKDVSIRNLATDVVPLKGYKRIIWIATTRSLATKPYTELYFQGWEDPDVPPTR